MEAQTLNRRPVLDVRKEMTLPDGTKIEVIGLTARDNIKINNNKSLSDAEKVVHITAAKILINGGKYRADDLLDCFTDMELAEIMKFANDVTDDQLKNV